MSMPSGIAIRRSARFEIVLPVRLRLPADQAAKVAFKAHQSTELKPAAPQDAPFIEGDLIDISRGGIGIMTPHFLPKGCSAEVRICALDADISRPLLVSKVRVQRVSMTDSRPAYLLGAAFIEADAVFEHDLQGLLNRLGHEEADAQPIDITSKRAASKDTKQEGAA